MKKLKELWQKSKRAVRNLGLAGLIAGGLAVGNKTEAVSVDGFVHNSYDGVSGKNCPVKIYIIRSPPSSGDTVYAITDSKQRYSQDASNFDPSATIGDTIYIEAKKDTLGKDYKAKTMWKIKDSGNYVFEITLDNPDNPSRAFTASLGAPFSQGWIRDTSGLSNPLNSVYWLAKNPEQKRTTQVDTGYVWPWDHFWRGYVNFEKQDSVAKHGDSAYISLEKSLGDTTWRTLIPFSIDTTGGDAMKVADTVYFPLEKIINDTTKPDISNVTEWPDTNYQGPYPISAEIYDGSGIDTSKTKLTWKLNNSDSTLANIDSIISNNYYFTIDTTADTGDSVFYKLKAVDASANQNEAYWPGPFASDWYSFEVNSIGVPEDGNDLEKEFKVWPSIVRNKLQVRGADRFDVSDIAGRKVKNYEANSTGAYDFDVPSGIYFVKSGDKTKKIVKLKR